MGHPAVRILLLEQGNRSLEDHTKDFVFLAPMTHYPDSSLCSFYRTGLNPTTRVQLSRDGPRESLAAYIEWVLVSSRSLRTMEDDTSPPTRGARARAHHGRRVRAESDRAIANGSDSAKDRYGAYRVRP
ncbi:hypothetical protein M9458_041226, partial [Cirrhinus mrigala]